MISFASINIIQDQLSELASTMASATKKIHSARSPKKQQMQTPSIFNEIPTSSEEVPTTSNVDPEEVPTLADDIPTLSLLPKTEAVPRFEDGDLPAPEQIVSTKPNSSLSGSKSFSMSDHVKVHYIPIQSPIFLPLSVKYG